MSQNVEPAIIPEGQHGKVGSGRPGSKPRSIAISTVGQFLPFLGSIRYARDTKSPLCLTGRAGVGALVPGAYRCVCSLF